MRDNAHGAPISFLVSLGHGTLYCNVRFTWTFSSQIGMSAKGQKRTSRLIR